MNQQLDPDKAIALLRLMTRIRIFESMVAKERELGTIGGPTHLCSGQEAIPAGISVHLSSGDYVFSAHRSHGHLLALGSDPRLIFAEILGRATGLNSGFGGSMHLSDPDSGFIGAVPIVAATIPIALGAAFSAKYKGTNQISVAYFGDGAIEEGIVHESFNLAKLYELPILFVCENNYFSSHMHISIRQPSMDLCRFAKANDIPYQSIDGNDVLEVWKFAEKMIRDCREGNGPAFIEARTYRHFGHVDWRRDLDVGIHRSKEDIDIWIAKDPIERFKKVMVESLTISNAKLLNIEEDEIASLAFALNQALKDPFPQGKEFIKGVFAETAESESAW